MATLYITEYDSEGSDLNGNKVQVAMAPNVAEQTVAIGGTSTQSAAFNANTRLIRVHTDAICSIKISANPTATAANKRMAANATEYFALRGNGLMLAVITNT